MGSATHSTRPEVEVEMNEFEIARAACEFLLAIGALLALARAPEPVLTEMPVSQPAPRPTVALVAGLDAMTHAERQLIMLGHALRHGKLEQVERFAKRLVDVGIEPPTTPEGCEAARAALRA